MDSKRLAEIADVMENRGLTRVRVEEPDGTAVELERASAAQPVAVPMPMPSAAMLPPHRGYRRINVSRRLSPSSSRIAAQTITSAVKTCKYA